MTKFFYDFFTSPSDHFDTIPIFWNFQDTTLRVHLIEFLKTWNNRYHIAWQASHCPEMVDHALHHSQNLFIIANRLFHDNDNLIDQLNDAEKFCFVVALYLHDIGMSETLFTPQQKSLKGLNEFLNKYADPHQVPEYKSSPSSFISSLTLKDLGNVTSGWVRNHHALLSKYVIMNDLSNIHFGVESHEQMREIVGNICLNHSGKIRLTKVRLTKSREYYTTKPVASVNSGMDNLSINSKPYKINTLFLSALLRFVDGCDQSSKRLINPIYAQQYIETNQSRHDYLQAIMRKEIKSKKYLKLLTDLSDSSEKSEPSQPELKRHKESIKAIKLQYPKLVPWLDEFFHICYYRRNMDYKKSVKDIYFSEGKIVLARADDYYSPHIELVKNDVLNELSDIKTILKAPSNDNRDLGIPTTSHNLYDKNCFIEEDGDCSQYEVPEYEPYQRVGPPETGYNAAKYIAQKLHESYIVSEREKGLKIIDNPQIHLWNRIHPRFQHANMRHGKDYFDYIAMINASIHLNMNNSSDNFQFTPEEIELLSAEEHNRWMNEKISEEWKYGKKRDDQNRIHPLIVPWEKLPEVEKDKDRNIIRDIPKTLHSMHLSITRNPLKDRKRQKK